MTLRTFLDDYDHPVRYAMDEPERVERQRELRTSSRNANAGTPSRSRPKARRVGGVRPPDTVPVPLKVRGSGRRDTKPAGTVGGGGGGGGAAAKAGGADATGAVCPARIVLTLSASGGPSGFATLLISALLPDAYTVSVP